MAAQLISIINVTVNATVLPWSLPVVKQGKITSVAHCKSLINVSWCVIKLYLYCRCSCKQWSLADVWQFVKGHPMAANVENLGLALLERAVWDETLFRAKAVEVEEISNETWAIYPIWRMFRE